MSVFVSWDLACLELNGGTNSLKIIASSQKALISLSLGGFECCKSVTTLSYKVGNEFSWFGWPDLPRNVSAQFFGRSGKVLYGAFSIVGMAYQSQYVNRAIPDDRVARSMCRIPLPFPSTRDGTSMTYLYHQTHVLLRILYYFLINRYLGTSKMSIIDKDFLPIHRYGRYQ